ncbi:uncharacterized protein LOC110446398 [Mizuhopecten yessoensis]|uniref:von Willebrand factor D and EGF domain-containing protein n=1 Tax=Mizuhopecten yessoensis TaxID=6573 RepID=A0A210QXM9_MIZYE|nr:uncharacterized protein LOC110446398 [Mizuhopecten yessoensis]OWF53474.1 von Willebrand factor D and EGF domain-containing protein [Mizuhopecten yessoensis]
MMQQILLLFVTITVGYNGVSGATDPCFSYISLNDSTRLTSYTLKNGESELSDAFLTTGWYRNVHRSDGDLMTTCPNQTDCGTIFPVWINGTLPSKGKIETVQACKHTFVGCCGSSSTIQVKRCDGFYVYNLHPMKASTGRYCFRGSRRCTGSESSLTGYAPCSSSHLSFRVAPRVSPGLTNNPGQRHLKFTCAGVSSMYRSLQFDVVWEVEGTEVNRKLNLSYSSLLTDGRLIEREWNVTGQNIGMHVRCAIRAHNTHSSTAFYYSQKFYAGFEIRQPRITVNSGDTAVVGIRTTVPIACPSIRPHCTIYIEMFDLSEQLPRNTQCNRNMTKLDHHNHSHCGVKFDGFRWRTYQNMVISALADQQYRSQYTAILKLRTLQNDYDSLWNNFVLPDIKVVITDPGVASKKGHVCKSITDPHIKQFDSTSYYGRQFASIGEYILYKNKEKPYSVQTISTNITDFGNCAVGVQAGADIFIIYGCEYPGKWVFKRYCSKDTNRLDIYEKDNGRNYEVHLPSGTYIVIKISPIYQSHYLDVEIHISPSEWNKTEGLCGTFNGNRYDDRIDRSGKTVSSDEQFTKAWSVSPTESMFVEKSRTAKLDRPYYFCSCNNVIGTDFHQSATCSWREGLPLCPSLNWNEQECSYRSKRDADGLIDDTEIDAPLSLVAYQPPPSNLAEWKNGWNRTSATEYCTRIITGSSAFAACKRHTTVNDSDSISICISDIQITGHTKFSSGAVESFKSTCSNEVRLNTSLWTSSTQGHISPAEEVMAMQCPNDCKQENVARGTCVQGTCQCFNRYTGPDCSIDINASPVLYPPTSNNLCDRSKASCGGVSLFGSNFDHSSDMKCKIQVMKSGNDADTTTVDTVSTIGAIKKSFSEVLCPLGNVRKRRSGSSSLSRYTQLMVSVSNNANNYSAPVPVVIYDSTCMMCTMPGGRIVCKQRNDICVTGDVCYSLSSEKCRNNKKHDDDDGDDKEDDHNNDKNSNMWIIGAVLGGLALIAIIGGVLYKFCVKSKMHVHDQYIGETYEDLHVYSNPPAATHYKK